LDDLIDEPPSVLRWVGGSSFLVDLDEVVLEDLAIEAEDEDESRLVEDELDPLQERYRALGKASVKVIDEYDDPSSLPAFPIRVRDPL